MKSMNRIVKLSILAAAVISMSGCLTRIQSGEVGVRVNMSKEVQSGELMPGSWNQTLVGEVITFPVKDVAIQIENKTPMTADNSALADFDVTAIYNIAPTAVAELYSTKSKAFHSYDEKEKDTLLMYNFITTLVNNASYKVVRQYKSLEVADNRQKIEQEILAVVTESLKSEKLDGSITVSMIQIRNILPNAQIQQAATELVKSQNELKIKENEVAIAKKESERMAALANNSAQSVQFMEAQAKVMIAEAVKAGKVQTIIIPSNMTSLMMSGE